MRARQPLSLLGIIGAGPALAQGAVCSFYLGVENLEADDAVVAWADQQAHSAHQFREAGGLSEGLSERQRRLQGQGLSVPGDEVVVIGSGDAFVCASYTGAKGRIRRDFCRERR